METALPGGELSPVFSDAICCDYAKHPYSTQLPRVPGRQQTDRAGARHGNLTPPRISPSCPHKVVFLWAGFSLGRSIITRLLMRVGLVRNQPQCETARHRLLFGRMGTAQHLNRPSLMQILSAQVVLAHPPASLQPPFLGGLSSADVSRCRIFSFQRLMKCHHS